MGVGVGEAGRALVQVVEGFVLGEFGLAVVVDGGGDGLVGGLGLGMLGSGGRGVFGGDDVFLGVFGS